MLKHIRVTEQIHKNVRRTKDFTNKNVGWMKSGETTDQMYINGGD